MPRHLMKTFSKKFITTFILCTFGAVAYAQVTTLVSEPSNVRVAPGINTFLVSWDVPLEDPNEKIIGYEARSTPNRAVAIVEPFYRCTTTSKATTTCTINVVHPENVTYFINVRALILDTDEKITYGPTSTSIKVSLKKSEPVPAISTFSLISISSMLVIFGLVRSRRQRKL